MLGLLLGVALLAGPQDQGAETKAPPPLLAVDADQVRTRVARAVGWLEKEQHPDGSWGTGAMDSVQFTNFSVETYYAFQLGANALAFLALSSIDPTPETDAALARSLEWLSKTRVPKRGSDWDVDCSWAALYGYQAMLAAWQDPRFKDEALRERIKAQGLEFYKLLEKNQEPHGGWGYYEGPVVSRRPTWATSFATACVVPALVRGVELGWPIDAKVIARARDYLERCRLPNGAYSYDLRPIPRVAGETIDDVKGSLGRIQVCNWALRRAKSPVATEERIREGLRDFFEHHKFLDAGRMRPIPHEAYYYVAAYFYMFGHCYAAQAINELPEAERADWHRQLRSHLAKIQWEDGSSIDFPNMSCMQIAGTSFSILAFQAGLPGSHVRL
jgi:Prenyltransferase and squalene oxidase repeat